jgi:hypothetical protein
LCRQAFRCSPREPCDLIGKLVGGGESTPVEALAFVIRVACTPIAARRERALPKEQCDLASFTAQKPLPSREDLPHVDHARDLGGSKRNERYAMAMQEPENVQPVRPVRNAMLRAREAQVDAEDPCVR